MSSTSAFLRDFDVSCDDDDVVCVDGFVVTSAMGSLVERTEGSRDFAQVTCLPMCESEMEF